MRIDALLSLSDQELEDVMGAVEIWCHREGHVLDSDVGRLALDLAARRRRDNALSEAQLVRILKLEMPKTGQR